MQIAFEREKTTNLRWMNMADLDFNVQRAKEWYDDVQKEVNETLELLQDVVKATGTAPGEDDAIFKGIEQAGQIMETEWNKLCDAFTDMCTNLKKVFDEWENRLQNAVQGFKDFVDDFSL